MMMMDNNRKEALDKATKAKQKMMMAAEMMKQLQPTVPEVTAANIDMQPAIIPNPKPEGPVINPNVFNPGNLYPGISGTSKLAANWNPMMDPAAGQNLGKEGPVGTTSPVTSGTLGIDFLS